MKPKPLTELMEHALATAAEHGGKLERHPGGFWSYPGCARRAHDGLPEWWVGASTVQALVMRERLSYSKWQPRSRGSGKFPIEATIKDDAA